MLLSTIGLALAALVSAPDVKTDAKQLKLEVDASEIARRIVHSKLTIPVAALTVKDGRATVLYPKWIPGEHAPDGPLAGVVNLKFTVANAPKDAKPLVWKRDAIEMYAFHVDVPAKADAIVASFDFVTPTDGGSFSGSTMGTENVGVVSFNQLVMVPEGAKSDAVEVATTLRVPRNWQLGTALPIGQKSFDVISFQPSTLTTLVDSPVNMGRHFKRFELDKLHGVSVAAESEAALDVPADMVTEWKQLVAEAGALFGARHYRRYEFLVTLSDHVDDFGLEHHESSDNRMSERALVDEDKRAYWASLLPHEYVHSWNGKYRRPAGLATGDYETPMTDELLWVYEGLTQYLGVVLSARSGLELPDESESEIAVWSKMMELHGGRTWRPLEDTAIEAQILYGAPAQWSALRRSVDFYDEGVLVWLDVDTRIRALTKGARSLDDFCKKFHGDHGDAGKPALVPYTLDDVVKALNEVAPFDWAAFFHERLTSTSKAIPADGIAASGWKIGESDEEPALLKSYEDEKKRLDALFSLGISLDTENGNAIVDVIPGSAADAAGIAPGMKLDGVNGRKFSKEAFDDAIKASAKKNAPDIELLVENGDFYRTAQLRYRGGARWPVLERDTKANGDDVLAKILAPQTAHEKRPAKKGDKKGETK